MAKPLSWYQYRTHLGAEGVLKYKVWKAQFQDGFVASAGLGDAMYFPTQFEAIKWCNEYDRKLGEM